MSAISTAATELPLPPRADGLPLIGSLIPMLGDTNKFMTAQYLKHGPVFRVHILNKRFTVLAGPEAVGLDGPRQTPETRLDFRCDCRGRQRQRDATLEFVEGFNLNGHDVLVLFDNGLVRGGGLEPPHHCWRQDLNLVRLPISPPAPLQKY